MDKKETTVKIPVPRLLKLVTGEQIIAGMYVTEGSDFIRLNDPYKLDLYADDMSGESYYVEEKMALKPWVFQATDKIFSIHKNNIMTLAVPNETLKDYYNNIRLNYTKTLEPVLKEKAKKDSMNEALNKMSDDDYFETLEYLKGNKTKH